MAAQSKITKLMPGGSSSDGKLATVRYRDEKNREIQLFFEPGIALPLILAVQGAALASATQRKEQPSPELRQALRIQSISLSAGRTQKQGDQMGIRIALDSGLEMFLPASAENLRRFSESASEALQWIDDQDTTTVQ